MVLLIGHGCTQADDRTAVFDRVHGLGYRSSSGSGTTNEGGEFRFASGDRVTFTVGDVILGSVDMRPDLERVTPAHLVPGADGAIESIDHPRVTNIARFIQSLDADGNVENGVTIPPDTRAAVSRHATIDFGATEDTFEADPAVTALGAELGTELRTGAEARNHLRRTLLGIRKMTDVQIPTRDPEVSLVADVFLPADPGEYPVVLSVTRYGKAFGSGCTCTADARLESARAEDDYFEYEPGTDKAPRRPNEVSVLPNTVDWVPHGYVLIRVDGRGTCNTPGRLHPYGAQEAEDIYDAIEWAGTQPWSNGRVGMWGISNTAANQLPAASLQPPHLKAIIPHSGDIDQYRDIVFQGGLYYEEYRENWFRNSVAGSRMRCLDQPYDDIVSIFRASRFDDPLVYGPYSRDPSTGDRQPIRPVSPDPSKLTLPMWSHSRQDMWPIHIRGGSEVFIQSASPHKKLWVEAGHEYSRAYAPETVALHIKFFDYWLKGVENDIMSEPPVRVDLRLPRDAENPNGAWLMRFENDWPIARTQYIRYYLDATDPVGDGVLSKTPPIVERVTTYSADVADETPCNEPGVSFVSQPLEGDLELAGYMKLGMRVSSTSTDMDIFATLRVMDEHGRDVLYHSTQSAESPVTIGFLKVSHRKLDAERSTNHQPVHTHTEEDYQPLIPGEPVDVEVELWPNTALVKDGHRLWVTIQPRNGCFGIDSHEYDESYHDGAMNTIYTGGPQATYLQIPVIQPDSRSRTH